MSDPTINPREPYDPWRDVPEPPAVGDEYDGNPIITRAVKSIYVFAPGAEYAITKDQAGAILRWWQYYSELSTREIDAILARFPEHAPPLLDDAGPYSLDDVERELRAIIGPDADRAAAARFLPTWKFYDRLTAEEVRIVLDRFGPMPGATQ